MTRIGTDDARSGEACASASAHLTLPETNGLLDTIDVPTVVVGRDCTVARFNRAAAEALGFTPTDIGQLPSAVAALAEAKDLQKLCAQVIADGLTFRRDVQNRDRWFVLRIAPYLAENGQPCAAVLTFTNVTGFRASVGQAIYEREYTKTILNAVEPLVVLNAALQIQTANRGFYELFGLSREGAQALRICDLGDENWKSLPFWASLKAIRSGDRQFKAIELERDFPEIGRRTVLMEARPLSSGESALILVLRDITERKQAEDKVRTTEQDLRDFIDNASVGMHWVGPDGIILWANQTELELLGYTREEYVGRHIAEFHVDAPVIENILQRLTAGETVSNCEARLKCKDGSIRYVWISSNVRFEGGKFIHTRCFTRDVTERKRAEEALRQSEERFRSLVSIIADVPWTADVEGKFVYPQPAWQAYTGQSWEQHRGLGWLEAIHPEDRDTIKTLWFHARQSGTMYRSTGRLWHAATERYRFFVACAKPLFDAGGSLREWVGSFTDIDAQKRAEEKLEQTVAERTAKLRETVNELESYSYSISHDMRAPLRAMQAYAQVLVDELGPRLDEHNRRYLDRITAASHRLDKLITDVLSYSRLARGDIDLVPVSLDKLVEDITSHYPALQSAEIQIANGLGTVVAAEALLTQAIANLLTNAAKFVPPGMKPNIRIWSEEVPPPSSAQLAENAAFIRLFIHDNGIGIAPDNHQRIFAIFARVHSEKEYEGTGIGLSVVKKAVERMNGKVGLTSELGKGSTFWIQLPKA